MLCKPLQSPDCTNYSLVTILLIVLQLQILAPLDAHGLMDLKTWICVIILCGAMKEDFI